MFETILQPVFSPLLKLPALVTIILISFLISLIITIVYKYMTDQVMMKDLKMRQKEMQKKMKENRSNPEKLMKIQKEAMDLNMKYMMQSFKPTLVTFLPIIIIFGWLNSTLAFLPIIPDQQFSVTLTFEEGTTGEVNINVPEEISVLGQTTATILNNSVIFHLSGAEGDYLLVFEHDKNRYEKELTITKEQRYAPVQKTFKNQKIKSITIGNEKLIAINIMGKEEGGLTKGRLGWLGTYIIFSIIFSMGLRKTLKIY